MEPPTIPSLFNQTGIKDHINSIINDIRNRDNLIKEIKNCSPDIVFHMAAQPLVRLSYAKPAETYEINIMGTVNILEAVRETPSIKSFINVTTDKVYENREWHWGYRENENLCGHDPYSNSKSCSELITYSYRNAFFNNSNSPSISSARSGNVIGGGDYSGDRIIPDCIRASLKGEKINIRNPHSTRPYQHVLDCISGYLLLAEKQYNDKSFEGAYNFGQDDESCITTGELAEIFCNSWSSSASWQTRGENGPHEANFLKLDCSKAKLVLNWKPRWDIKTAVEKTNEFSKSNSDNERHSILNKQINEYFGAADV